MKKFVIIFLVFISSLTFSQQYRHGQQKPFHPNCPLDERPLHKLQKFKLQKLIEELEITDNNKIKKITQVFNNHFKNIHDLQFDRRNLLDELEAAIIDGNFEKAFEISNKLFQAERNFANARIQYFDDMKNILTNDEFSKFMLFEFRFQQLVKDFMDKRKNNPK